MTAVPPPSAAVPDPADVEKAARAMWEADHEHQHGTRRGWEDARYDEPDTYRRLATAALTAVRPSPDSEADRLRAAMSDLADELEDDSRDAMRLSAAARDRGDREAHRINARHGRVSHHAAARLRAALGTGDREGADRG